MNKENKIVSLYPLTKFYLALVMAVITAMAPGVICKVICFAIINIVAAGSGIWGEFIRRIRNSIAILFVILLLMQTFFYPSDNYIFSIGFIHARWEGLMFALRLGFTLLGVGGSLIWFFAVTREKDFVLTLQKQGLNPKASYVVLSTLQIIPQMKKRSQTIMNAQMARGVETEGSIMVRAKVFVPTLIPLVLSSITGTEERALTLEARGFSSKAVPTNLEDIERTPRDHAADRLITVILVIAIIGRIVLWLI